MEELTANQIEELRAALHELRETLTKLESNLGEDSKPVSLDQPIGRLSRMDAMQVQQMAQANRRTTQRRLEAIKAALQRLATDEFGCCLECDDDIGYARLKARPEAHFCMACQTRREKRA